MRFASVLNAILILMPAQALSAQPVDPTLHHLRFGPTREWDDFPEQPEAASLRLPFTARANATELTLRLRHRDLRHPWLVLLNGRQLATLAPEDNGTVALVPVPRGALRDGANELTITCSVTTGDADDVSIGDITLIDKPRDKIVAESSLDVTVTDADTGKPLPCRVTLVDSKGYLVPLGTESATPLAVRPGVLYTATGGAKLHLPAGAYTLYATRGFEWGLASTKLDLRPGENPPARLAIRREVDTRGLVAADTHIHTFTYSRHGDATLAERMITLAGEGIELPVATDHNLTIDYTHAARAAGVRQYFTPLVGDEVTTPKLGHFNVFPLDPKSPLIDFRAPTWEKLFASIDAIAPGAVVILNHPRDLHGGFRPFDPVRHIALVGQRLDGQTLRASAMEVLNSGATLNDPLALYNDWTALLNRGLRLTPVGASDSHDVTRFVVGQGRTYIAADDTDPGAIDVPRALDAFRRGSVSVSYGLLTRLKVNNASPGDLVTRTGDLDVEVTVSGPSWTRATHVELRANGLPIRQADIPESDAARPGTKATLTWRIPKPPHDVYLTALATGPGVTAPYWPGAKPYQRTSPHWTPYVLGVTGAVYIDADGSGQFDPAFTYATRLMDAAHNDPAKLVTSLATYDAAVAAQAASLLRDRHILPTPAALEVLAATAPPGPTRDGLKAFAEAWRTCETAAAPPHP
jgi:hypothetical protein